MKSSDKMLVGIVAGIVLLVVVALVATLTRPPAEYQAEDSPGGIVHNYLLALKQEDYQRAYRYLSPSIKCYPPSVSAFTADVRGNSWSFGGRGESSSWAVEDLTVRGDWATVEVAETRFQDPDLFESGQSFSRFEVELTLEEEGWRLIDGDRYFASWTWTSRNCE